MKIRDLFPGTPLSRRTIDNSNVDRTDKSAASRKTPSNDSKQISEEAKQLQQAARLIQESVHQLHQMPDAREEAVQQAKERVASGFYDNPDILDNLAGILTEHLNADGPLSASDLATDVIATIAPEQSTLTRVDLEDIKKNIEGNLYQNEVVIDKVAARILRFLHSLPDSD